MITPTHSVCSYKPFSFIARKRLQNVGSKLETIVIVTNNQTWQWIFTSKRNFFSSTNYCQRLSLTNTKTKTVGRRSGLWKRFRLIKTWSYTFLCFSHFSSLYWYNGMLLLHHYSKHSTDGWMDGWMHGWMHRWLINISSNIQARGPKKHMKRLNAPKHWMLDKLLGEYSIFSPFYE